MQPGGPGDPRRRFPRVAASRLLLALALAGSPLWAPRAARGGAEPGGSAAPARAEPSPGAAAETLVTREFAAVVVRPGDTLEALASRWLRDPGRDWMIAEFNGVAAAVPGAELAVPRRPFRRGGLTALRYQTVPVLSYHHIAERSTGVTTVAREAFEAQMRLLKERGYRPVTLEQLLGFLEFRDQLPEKAVVITFDDGWRSTYDVAFPILRRLGFPATLFVYADLISGDARTLSWEQLREMAAAGFAVESHTLSHRDLTVQKPGETPEEYLAAVEREIAESARVIEQRIGQRPRFLAYPFGATNGLVVALARKHGYRGAFTVRRDGNAFFTPPFRLNRSMIAGDFDLARFERNLVVSDRRALR